MIWPRIADDKVLKNVFPVGAVLLGFPIQLQVTG